jgi:large subunit ribosomal protein L13
MQKKEDVGRAWVHIDASGKVLGRLAVRIARMLMGKDKPTWTPHVDCGDFVVVTNCERIAVTGRKRQDRLYWRDSQHPGSLRSEPMASLLARRPERVLILAVRRMLPKSVLGRHMLRKLKVYAGPDHPHEAQGPATRTVAGCDARARKERSRRTIGRGD